MERLLVVSNRLPVTITDNQGKWEFKMSSGGLVSALSGLKKTTSFIWIGWPGLEIAPDDQLMVRKKLLDEHSCYPVFLPNDIADLHYNGFSNRQVFYILWPLFHYMPGEMNFDDVSWQAYRQGKNHSYALVKANHMFAEAVAEISKPGDMIWVHDYHLMILPSMLRELAVKDVKLGFFLHTPFPSSEVYSSLPVRKQVLIGLLSCDLIGFHTYDYARHFLSSCTRILGLKSAPNRVEFESRQVHVGTFPIGIDPEKFLLGLQEENVIERINRMKGKFNGKKIIVGVDRLDYIKGVPQKLHALAAFFEKHPEFVEQVIFIQVAVPSRTDVEEYIQLRAHVNELVGSINGQFGTMESMPVHFVNKSISFEELVALYNVADVCIVSSIRDGMNLVSYEYIASQKDSHGVLILSEFAGAAQSLNGSIIVNPWNIDELSNAIYEALTMSQDQRENNHSKLFRYVTKYTAAFWGLSFINELKSGPITFK